jgi:hypothetical protein
MLKEYNNWGLNPLLEYMRDPKISIMCILIAADNEVVMYKGVDNVYEYIGDHDENSHGDLPLHVLIKHSPGLSPVSERAM